MVRLCGTGAITILLAAWNISGAAAAADLDNCSYNGIELKGEVEIVDRSGDIKIEIVDNFADIHVQRVDNFADACGQWKIVDNFSDFTIEIVDNFGDIDVKWVDNFPGVQQP